MTSELLTPDSVSRPVRPSVAEEKPCRFFARSRPHGSTLSCSLVIIAVCLALFSELVLHPGQVLYSDYSDFLTLHLPAKRFLVRAWQQTGEVPLWCPYVFCGMPFVHDVQSAAFYPPQLFLYLVPEERVGVLMSWLLAAHVACAGLCMFAYARGRGLGYGGALVAALGYMLMGKWLLHLLAGGHCNMVPLAWLPLGVLWLEQAMRRGSLVRATCAGAVFSLLVLGAYPYVTFYAALFVVLWTAGTLFEGSSTPGGECGMARAVARWVWTGAWSAAVAIGLGAVQLLPGLEAAREASRGLGVQGSADFLTASLHSLVGLIGPPLTHNPDWLWENRTGIGLVWLGVAAIGLAQGGRRSRFEACVCSLLVVFSLGGALLFQSVPGFRLFQLPSRALLLLALPVAWFSGQTTEAMLGENRPTIDAIRRARHVFTRVVGFALCFLVASAVALRLRGEQLRIDPYWPCLIVLLATAWWLLRPDRRLLEWQRRLLWTAVLTLDAFLIGRPWVDVRPERAVYEPSLCIRRLAQAEPGRVLDFGPPGRSPNATPLWPGMATVTGIVGVRGFNPVDVLRFKKYLQFLTNHDESLRPLDRMFTSAVLGAFPIRNQPLADVLGIRYLVQPAGLPLEATIEDVGGRASWRLAWEDRAPQTFGFISQSSTGEDCGLQRLPPYRVYENTSALPRAFVVRGVAPLIDGPGLLAQLKRVDLRKSVLLSRESLGDPSEARSDVKFKAARVVRDLPNEVTVDVSACGTGFLVLTDVWYPGWNCAIDGQPTEVLRADYLFRAVRLPSGSRQAVFRFRPISYRSGQVISLACLTMVLVLVVFAGAWPWSARASSKLELHS